MPLRTLAIILSFGLAFQALASDVCRDDGQQTTGQERMGTDMSLNAREWIEAFHAPPRNPQFRELTFLTRGRTEVSSGIRAAACGYVGTHTQRG